MAISLYDANNDPLAVLGINTSSQRAQLAQYSIMRAASYLQSNQNDEALKQFKKALAFDSQNLTAQSYVGKLNLAKGNNFEAIKAFKAIVKSQPSSADALINLANAYLQDKQYSESEKELKAAARLDPKNPLPDYSLGHQYLMTGRMSEAESQFKKVQKISPRDGNVYYSLGALYNKQGKFDEAVKNLEKALSLNIKTPDANYELGVAYSALGRTEDAQKQLSLLSSAGASQAADLQTVLDKPAIAYMDTNKVNGFSDILGPGTPLWMLDPTLLTNPDSSKVFSVTIQFTNQMDIPSITNPLNWSISRANSTDGGYYNNTMPLTAKDAALPANPESVSYNSYSHEATVMFRLSQNSSGNAVIDPSHITFKFSGKDAVGRSMDQTADEVNGYALAPF